MKVIYHSRSIFPPAISCTAECPSKGSFGLISHYPIAAGFTTVASSA